MELALRRRGPRPRSEQGRRQELAAGQDRSDHPRPLRLACPPRSSSTRGSVTCSGPRRGQHRGAVADRKRGVAAARSETRWSGRATPAAVHDPGDGGRVAAAGPRDRRRSCARSSTVSGRRVRTVARNVARARSGRADQHEVVRANIRSPPPPAQARRGGPRTAHRHPRAARGRGRVLARDRRGGVFDGAGGTRALGRSLRSPSPGSARRGRDRRRRGTLALTRERSIPPRRRADHPWRRPT